MVWLQVLMSDMEMDSGVGRSYRYYDGPQLYSFGSFSVIQLLEKYCERELSDAIPTPTPWRSAAGYGITLTTFSLSAVSFPPSPAFVAEAVPSSVLNFSVSVTNTGLVPGDEVVQVGVAKLVWRG
jgi:hypothetical protein